MPEHQGPVARDLRERATIKLIVNGAQPHRLTGELQNKVDQVWNAFGSGGIANPLKVIEQITDLRLLPGRDSDQTGEENKTARLKTEPLRRYPAGAHERGMADGEMRWSRLKNKSPAEMFKVLGEHVFAFCAAGANPATRPTPPHRDLRAPHARRPLTIPTAALLANGVDLLDGIPMDPETPRATSTNTGPARSPRPDRTDGSGRRGTSSS